MYQEPYESSDPLRSPPWEERGRYGFLNALYLTTKDVLFAPGTFFQRMPTGLGLLQPLLFAITLSFLAAFFDFLWGLSGSSLQRVVDRGVNDLLRAPVILGFLWLLSPVVAVVEVSVRAALFHLCLMLAGGKRLGFEATFRVVAYARGAGIISLVPICGAVLAWFWELVVTVLGLARIHGVEEWRALIAVLLPVILFLLSCGGLAAAIIGAGLLT